MLYIEGIRSGAERPSRGSYISRECNLKVSIKVHVTLLSLKEVTCPSYYIFLLIPLSYDQNAISPLTASGLMLLCTLLFIYLFPLLPPPPIHLLEPREGALFFKMMEMHMSGDGDKIAILVFKFQIGFIEKICGYITRCFITVIVSPLHAHLLVSFEFFLRSIDHE